MKLLLLSCIRMYWKWVPVPQRGSCLFSTTCSHYIYEQTNDLGFLAGLKAFGFRYRNCREGYSLFKNPVTGKTQMVLRTNQIIGEDEISPSFLSKKSCA
ncbi:membrane protein insertion efficiency factor YidD [Gillisia limnaea]|uniref:Membrane protein insertion efficiency factor YidD n=1 Tax=Gillisia limnaea (strain DSM 15749 / LMG 21470 / R-8282) TaxID=865937 RepID=H2BSV8_GILLR|nr:membrane protein insertion efficiency factor YidD [Gillisia limnaea]EHQ01488.1 hypothetical protein Gilli_0788 [Gillisia limnaea DSM 15749]